MLSRKTKKNIRRLLYYGIAFIVAMTITITLYQWLHYKKKGFVRYPEFGISIPENYSIHGIDVSRYQESIVWEEVKAMKVKEVQLGFSFIKATEGISNIDPQFKRNWKRTKDNGIIRGAYHFFIGSKDGKMQAENFIDNVDLQPGDLPPVLDIEQLNGATTAQVKIELKEWLQVIEDYYHVKPIIYSNVDFYNRNLGTDFDEYPLWIAHYFQPGQPRISRGWMFWQHSQEGRVNGVASKVDFNVFNGDSLEFKNLLME